MEMYVRAFGLTALLAITGVLGGCASAPTQEMSDARQSVQAARDAGAPIHTPKTFGNAENLLSQAEVNLGAREFKLARRDALDSKQEAIKARNMTVAVVQARGVVAEAEQLGASSTATRDRLKEAEEAARAGDEEISTRLANEVRLRAEDDIHRARAQARQNAERENRDWLLRAQPLLDQARAEEATMTAEERARWRTAEDAYQNQEGRQAYEFSRRLLDQIIARRPLPVPAAESAETAETTVAAASPAPPARIDYTVRRGDTLWRIAARKEIYGNPYRWPLIYRDNKDKIKDPNVIQQGQVFDINLAPAQEDIDDAVEFARNRGAWSLRQKPQTPPKREAVSRPKLKLE